MQIARKMGADVTLNFNQVDVVEEILRLTGGRGVDAAIEALGLQSTFESALRVLKPGGTLSSLGVYSTDLLIPWRRFMPGWVTTRSLPHCVRAARNACAG